MSDLPTVAIPERHHAILNRCHHAVLSTVRHNDGLISSNPVSFVWEDGVIRVSTIKSRMKYKNIVANPMISFVAISPKNVMEYIEVRGYATIEEDKDRSFFRKQFMASAGTEPPEGLDSDETERVIITIHPQQVSSPKVYGDRFDKMAKDMHKRP